MTVRDTTNATGTGPAQTVGVKSNWPPKARFSVTPQCATSGTTMTFDASATTDSDSVVNGYHWDFGDGTTADTATPTTTHSYDSNGTYFAELTASDGVGHVGPRRARDHHPGDELPAAGRVLHVRAEQPPVRQSDHVHRPRDRPGRLDRVLHVELG